MNDQPARIHRCVIWFGQPGKHERQMLAAAGWQLRCVAAGSELRIGERGDDLLVAIIDARQGSAEANALLAQFDLPHLSVPLLLLTDATHADAADLQPLLDACRVHLQAPLQADALEQALLVCAGTIDGPIPVAGDVAMLGSSPPMLEVLARVHRFAGVELPVLLTGDTGTGKELAARALHRHSPRAPAPFVAVNCGAMPAGLVQSELFGHERGAFTGANTRRIGHFEAAHGGTLFLDEIGDLPLDAQVNLLRVLQEGRLQRVGASQPVDIDVRVVAATHVDLQQAVADGRFRQDLLFRLDVLHLHLPPLRQRGGDIDLLARSFLDEFRRSHGSRARGFTPCAREALASHDWPGNVRELLNRVRRAAVVASGTLLSARDLELDGACTGPSQLDAARVRAEREAVLQALRETGYNVSACARRLKVSRVTVYRLCQKHRLSLPALRA